MRIIILLYLVCLTWKVSGNHLYGGEISYKKNPSNTYTIRVQLLSVCPQIVGGNIIGIRIQSSSLNYDSVHAAELMYIDTIQNYCNTILTSCQTYNSPFKGQRNFVYECVTPLAPAPDWQFTYSVCCRNNGIANLPVQQDGFAIRAKLNNASGMNNYNSNPNTSFNIPLNLFINQPVQFNILGADPDADSLDIVFISPQKMGINDIIPLVPAFNPATPLGFNACSINAQTGMLQMNRISNGNFSLAIEINEYRNGLWVGSSMKDVQITVVYGNNFLPQLSGINGTSVFIDTLFVCTGESFNFYIKASDSNTTDSLKISINPNDIPGAYLTSNLGLQPTDTFHWTPTINDIRPYPYALNVVVKDNRCELIGIQSYLFQLYVKACPDPVWPGDANADLRADNGDVLHIGLAYGLSGPARPNASVSWTAQLGAYWQTQFTNTLNHKHADGNGDGIVSHHDTAAITANYGLTHLKEMQANNEKPTNSLQLYFDTHNIIAIPGTTIEIPIKLGNNIIPAPPVYGLAASIHIDHGTLQAPILSNNNSWLGTSNQTILYQHPINPLTIPFALTRINQTSTAGFGEIARMELQLAPNLQIGDRILLQCNQAKIINHLGVPFTNFIASVDTLFISAPNAIQPSIKNTFNIQVYPNVVKKTFTIEQNEKNIENIEAIIYNQQGAIVARIHLMSPLTTVNAESWIDGIYYVVIKKQQDAKTYTIIKSH